MSTSCEGSLRASSGREIYSLILSSVKTKITRFGLLSPTYLASSCSAEVLRTSTDNWIEFKFSKYKNLKKLQLYIFMEKSQMRQRFSTAGRFESVWVSVYGRKLRHSMPFKKGLYFFIFYIYQNWQDHENQIYT